MVYEIIKPNGLVCFHCRKKDDIALLKDKFEILHPKNIDGRAPFLVCRKK